MTSQLKINTVHPVASAGSVSLLRTTIAGLALADAMIHAAVLPEHFQKSQYMGILFTFALIFLGMLAIGLTMGPSSSGNTSIGRITKASGLLLMAGLIAGYFVTRTIGLPGFHGDWNDVGLTTVALEAAILLLLFVDLSASQTDGNDRTNKE